MIRVMAVPQERGAPAWSVRLAADLDANDQAARKLVAELTEERTGPGAGIALRLPPQELPPLAAGARPRTFRHLRAGMTAHHPQTRKQHCCVSGLVKRGGTPELGEFHRPGNQRDPCRVR
jgi:hypothetical protein